MSNHKKPDTNMKNLVETIHGETVEIINGTLVCKNVERNWKTIGDWMVAHDFPCQLIITVVNNGKHLNIEMPETTPVYRLESLLEHFEYQ